MISTLCLVVMAGLCYAVTTSRDRLWRTPREVWAEAVRQAPRSPRPLMNYAQEMALDGADGIASGLYLQAVALSDTRPRLEGGLSRQIARRNIDALTEADEVEWITGTK